MANETRPRKRITRAPRTTAPRVARKKVLSDETAAEIAPVAETPPIVVEAIPEPAPEPAPAPAQDPTPAAPPTAFLAPPPAPMAPVARRHRRRFLSSVLRRLRHEARRMRGEARRIAREQGAPMVRRLASRFPRLAALAEPLRRRLHLD